MRNALRQIADALNHPKAPAKLKLKAGRGESSAEKDARNELETNIVGTVWLAFNDFGRMKPAVYAACDKYKVSDTTVYKAIRSKSWQAKTARDLGMMNLQPKSQEQWSAEIRAAYNRYMDWLYGFGGEAEAEKD